MTENIEATTAEANAIQEPVRGERGIVGEATPAKTLKKYWQQEKRLSLKSFARKILTGKNDNHSEMVPIVKAWFANKTGANNAKRGEATTKRIELEKQASKASRRKAGQSKQKAAAPAA